MWGWFWRGIVVTIATGGVVGLFMTIVGTIIAIISPGIAPTVLTIIFLIFSIPIGIITIHPLIHWILVSKISGYRILLCRKRDNEDITIEVTQERKIVAL